MFSKLTTEYFIEELPTDGHSPSKFICSDGAIYYLKYRSGNSMDRYEINCLLLEIICSRLLVYCGIPTPEIALVEIAPGSFKTGDIAINKRTLRPNTICLGFRELTNSDMVSDVQFISDEMHFSKILNPIDLILISIFDLWVDNHDRWEGNYNILFQRQMESDKIKYFAIDHAFTFGGGYRL